MDNNIRRVAVIGMTENRGGIESVIMNIYRNIDRTKVQFDFLLPHGFGKMAFEDEVIKMGGRIFRIIYSERESIWKAKQTLLQYFKEHPEVKVVHLHSNFPYAFPLKIAKKAGVPTRILHSHNSVILFDDEKSIKNKIKAIRNFIVYKQIDKFPNVYFSCSDLAAKSTFKDHEYVWIKNGIELEQFKYNKKVREELREEYGVNENEQLIGFVGRLCSRKNPLYVLEVFKEYNKINPRAKLAFIGEGELKELIQKKIHEYGLEDKVILPGMIVDAYKWYQAFDLFLLPSLFEGLPVVLVEGQVAGLPCIVSDTITKQINLTELIKYKSNKLPAEEWARDIKVMIEKKIDRTKYKDEMYKAGFDVKSMAKEVEQYYMAE